MASGSADTQTGQPGIGAKLEGRVAVVSGASSGIGRAIATRLAADGATVLCGDLQPEAVSGSVEGGDTTVAEITATGREAMFIQWDVTDDTQTAEAFAAARTTFGRLDIIVANAGVAIDGQALPDEEPGTWDRQLAVNLTGTWKTVRGGLKELIAQNEGGRIVTISSTAATTGMPGLASAYGISKAGVIQLTRQAAAEGAAYGITANSVCPGYVRTALNRAAWSEPDVLERIVAMHPLGRLGEPTDVAAAVAFFASADASWITGAVLPVDGGMTAVLAA